MRKILVTVAAALCLSQAAFAEESSTKEVTPDTAVPAVDTPAPTTPPTTPAPQAEVTTPAPTPAPGPKAEVAPAPTPTPAPKADIHEATWKNGHGSSWKIGPHTYGFEGFFGGCHYTGHAGPHGYHLDKAC